MRCAPLLLLALALAACGRAPDLGPAPGAVPGTAARAGWPALAPLADLRAARDAVPPAEGLDSSAQALSARAAALRARAAGLAVPPIDPAQLKRLQDAAKAPPG